MMSKKKWIVLLLLFIVYLFLGASFFYKIESEEEFKKLLKEERDKVEIQNILRNHFTEPEQIDILIKLSQYCGKSMINITDEEYNSPPKWDFYHSLFFSITVVSTIGYGNLAPTTSASRIFMIWYGLIGIPINGILFANLGDFFGQIFIKLYRKWKNSKVKNYAGSLGLVSQIILYLIPGFAIFIFLPAFVIMHFEKWDYVLSVYYAFVTLTTIGFGDYVAGVENRGFHELYFVIYQIFLVVWIIFGLGYLVMIIGFITRGMRSKKMVLLEKQLTSNIKSTHTRIWHGFVKDLSYLRRIMNELYMSKFKPVYRYDYSGTTTPKIGSQSFPDLRKLVTSEISPPISRRRAHSECVRSLTRVQSDTDLSRIDKEATFAGLAFVQPSELLYKVANAFTSNALDDPLTESDDEGGIHGFSDSDILASEIYGSGWTIGSNKLPAQPPKVPRHRAASEVKFPHVIRQDNMETDWTWSGPEATQKIKELRLRNKFNKSKPKLETIVQMEDNASSTTRTIFDKIRNTISRNKDEVKNKDVEKQLSQNQTTVQSRKSIFTTEQENYFTKTGQGRASVFSVPESKVLEETSVADLLRALTSLHSRVAGQPEVLPQPRRKFGTASLTPPKTPSMLELFTPLPNLGRIPMTSRKSSMTPATVVPRRFSLHPVSEDQLMMPPPPYTRSKASASSTQRPFAAATTIQALNPLHKQVSRLRGTANERILYTRTRHNSLKDIRIERPQ